MGPERRLSCPVRHLNIHVSACSRATLASGALVSLPSLHAETNVLRRRAFERLKYVGHAVKLSEYPEDIQRRIRAERRSERLHAKALVEACRRGDAARFYHLAYPYDEYPNFWPRALHAIVREISEVKPDIQDAFLKVWVQTKMLGLRVDNNRTLCRALRVLTPGYKGEALRLFRGTGAGERRRAAYGVSWTSDLSAAEGFAESYRDWSGGSIVLETVAPPEAIISAVEYPPPITEAEKAELPPNVKVVEYHEEREYLVERRLLGPVKVLRRYPQLERPPSQATPRL
jgi:hypothetical protein